MTMTICSLTDTSRDSSIRIENILLLRSRVIFSVVSATTSLTISLGMLGDVNLSFFRTLKQNFYHIHHESQETLKVLESFL